MRKIIASLALLCCLGCAQNLRYDSVPGNTAATGQPGSIQLLALLPGSTYNVCTGAAYVAGVLTPCASATATITSDQAGTQIIPQPAVASAANGNVGFFIAAGTYTVTATPPAGTIGQTQSWAITPGLASTPQVSVTTAFPAAPATVTATVVGTPGSTQYHYWVVSNFTIGNSAPSASAAVTTAAATLTSYNYDQVTWTAVAGANTYDLLRTTGATAPTGACACAVATAVSGLTANDQSNSLNAYTVSTYAGDTTFHVTNAAVAGGESQLTFAADHGTQFKIDSISGAELTGINVSGTGYSIVSPVNNVSPGVGHFIPLSVVGTQAKAGSNLNAAGINVSMNVSGNLGSSYGVGSADWGIFSFGNASNLVNNPAFYETDGEEAEATYTGTLAAPNNFRLVSLGAQSWVNNTTALTTAAVPHAISIWARAPYLNGSTGSGTIADAVGLSVDQPSVGTAQNHAVEINPSTAQSSLVTFLQGGNPLWNVAQVDNATSHSYDFQVTNSLIGGIGLRLQNGSNGNTYIGAAGSGSVIVCGAPTFGGESPTSQCTGGLAVYAGGSSGSLAPVAGVGLIRLPNNAGVVARNAGNTADLTLIQSTAGDKVEVDSNGAGTILGGGFSAGGGQTIASTNAVALTSELVGAGSVTTTAATSDSVTITWPDGGTRTPGHCSMAPTDASAATNIATSYISAKGSNALTLTHTATASMTYDFTCTVN